MTTTQPSRPPAGEGGRPPSEPMPGSLDGNVPYLFAKLEEAFLTERERKLATGVLWRSYVACPPYEEWEEITAPGGSNPWLGWARIAPGEQQELARTLRIDARSPGSFSTLLARMEEKLRVLERAFVGGTQYLRLRAPCDWHPDVFDVEKAKERAARQGAGRPASPRPETPPPPPRREDRRQERQDHDDMPPPPAREHRPLEEAVVVAALADLDLSARIVEGCWVFVRHFQVAVQPFRLEWLPALVDLIAGRGFPPSLLTSKLDELLRDWTPREPWGYLVATMEAAPRLRRASEDATTADGQQAASASEERGERDEQDETAGTTPRRRQVAGTAARTGRGRPQGRGAGGDGGARGVAGGRRRDAGDDTDFNAFILDADAAPEDPAGGPSRRPAVHSLAV